MTGLATLPVLRGSVLGFSRCSTRTVILSNSVFLSRVFICCSPPQFPSVCIPPPASSNSRSLSTETLAPKNVPQYVSAKRIFGRSQRRCYAGAQVAAGSAMKAVISSSKSVRFIHSECWELMKSVESHGSLSAPYMMKVLAGCFLSDGHKVPVLEELEQALGSPLDKSSQAPAAKPLVIVISGPSGVGKDAVIKRLQEVRSDIHFVVTVTTRPIRPGEVEGLDYYFVSKSEFQNMIERNELLEHAMVYGDYKGIPKKQVRDSMSTGRDVLLRLDVQGAATVKRILGQEAVFIFMVAESEYALVNRLVERKTESLEKLLLRIATARDEVKLMTGFDYVVVNADGQLERTVLHLCSIIDAEKARVHQRFAQL